MQHYTTRGKRPQNVPKYLSWEVPILLSKKPDISSVGVASNGIILSKYGTKVNFFPFFYSVVVLHFELSI